MNNEQEPTNRDIALKISSMHNTLSALDISRIDHYNRCHRKGSVPVAHPTIGMYKQGAWYNSYALVDMILLYIRLPDRCKPFCTRPQGYGEYKRERKDLH